MYYAVQALTLAILVLAANTSFQGFPRLAALLARDGFAPRQFTNLGDRLVFSNGMLVLATLSALLLWIYRANVDSLIHLYVIGVFTAFTLSQLGMVRYWRRVRDPGWHYRAVVNGVGATATGIVTAVVVVTKFAAGAWIVTIAIPGLVLLCYGIRRHYRGVERRLRAGAEAVIAAPAATNTALVTGRVDRRGDRGRALVRPIHHRRALQGDPRSPAVGGPGDQTALVPVRGRAISARSPGRISRAVRRGPRASVATAAGRVGLRHRGHPRALSPAVAPRRREASARAAAQASPALGARRRRGRRSRSQRDDGGDTRKRRRPGSRLRCARRLDARGQLRQHTQRRRHASDQLRVQRRGGRCDPPRLARARARDPTRRR